MMRLQKDMVLLGRPYRIASVGTKNRTTYIKPTTVIFPGLRQWMTEHHVRVAELERRTGRHLRQALSAGRISNQSIERILAVTGLTYEQAFRR